MMGELVFPNLCLQDGRSIEEYGKTDVCHVRMKMQININDKDRLI